MSEWQTEQPATPEEGQDDEKEEGADSGDMGGSAEESGDEESSDAM